MNQETTLLFQMLFILKKETASLLDQVCESRLEDLPSLQEKIRNSWLGPRNTLQPELDCSSSDLSSSSED